MEARARRAAYVGSLAPGGRAAAEAALAAVLAPWLCGCVGGYAPIGAEIAPPSTNALPWFADRHAPMLFRLAPVAGPGPFGIRQPRDDAPCAQPAVLLLPLLAADMRGTRLGQGGGHYDRYLAATMPRPLAIGLAWECQVVAELPRDRWDVALDMVATPTRLLDLRRA